MHHGLRGHDLGDKGVHESFAGLEGTQVNLAVVIADRVEVECTCLLRSAVGQIPARGTDLDDRPLLLGDDSGLGRRPGSTTQPFGRAHALDPRPSVADRPLPRERDHWRCR